MTQKHSLVILAVALLLCCTLCGCQTKREKEVYVPEDEWTGLQTDAYVEYMVEKEDGTAITRGLSDAVHVDVCNPPQVESVIINEPIDTDYIWCDTETVKKVILKIWDK